MLKEATDKNFKEVVLRNDKEVLVDFYASWCGPCMMQAPELEELASSRGVEYDIVKVNIEEAQNIANNYKINTVPTLMIFKKGKLKKRSIGFMKKEEIRDMMNE